MKKQLITLLFIASTQLVFAQTNPAISSWIQNTTGIKGQHYVSGNSTVIQDNDSANVKTVLYSTSWVYVRANGIPAYPTGPFLDGNPSLATTQNAIFKMPLNRCKIQGQLQQLLAVTLVYLLMELPCLITEME